MIARVLDVWAALLLVPVAVLCVETLLALLPTRRAVPVRDDATRVAVLVPAHDEAEGIAPVIDGIRMQLGAHDRLLVVADNCSDATATVAREHGAEVIERFHDTQRGKGYALDFGVRHLAAQPPDVLIVIDADCTVHAGAIDRLAARVRVTNRPVQGLDLMRAPPQAGIKAKVAEFAWLLKNQVRPRGLARIGLPCPLMGTGMALPWQALAHVQLASASLAEDMQLGIHLAQQGFAPLFEESALVTSDFPLTAAAQATQRTRWEHGHLGMILAHAPRLLLQGMLHADRNRIAMALDMGVPPLALLALLLVTGWLAGLAAALAGVGVVPLCLFTLALGMFALAILLAWYGWGRQAISLGALLHVPLYVLGKIPHYLRFVFKREKRWVRTQRDKPDG